MFQIHRIKTRNCVYRSKNESEQNKTISTSLIDRPKEEKWLQIYQQNNPLRKNLFVRYVMNSSCDM